jgi:hypothetical protein
MAIPELLGKGQCLRAFGLAGNTLSRPAVRGRTRLTELPACLIADTFG